MNAEKLHNNILNGIDLCISMSRDCQKDLSHSCLIGIRRLVKGYKMADIREDEKSDKEVIRQLKKSVAKLEGKVTFLELAVQTIEKKKKKI